MQTSPRTGCARQPDPLTVALHLPCDTDCHVMSPLSRLAPLTGVRGRSRHATQRGVQVSSHHAVKGHVGYPLVWGWPALDCGCLQRNAGAAPIPLPV